MVKEGESRSEYHGQEIIIMESIMHKLFSIVIVPAMAFSTAIHADEGMYLLTNLDRLHLKSRGLKIEIEDIFHPEKPSLHDTVVLIKQNGTGSFVSTDGLILTNYHVIEDALHLKSTINENLVKNGFLAQTRREEIPADGFDAKIVIDYVDVTHEIEGAVDSAKNYSERMTILRQKAKTLKERLPLQGDHERMVTTHLTHRGSQWYIIKMMIIKDVRIVYAPPYAIGRFGGEVENWQWPNHAGDFAFLRAYVSPEGKGVDYSPDNVVYHPRKHLKICTEGLMENDFVFILGFPGTSHRYMSSFDIDYVQNIDLPWEIEALQQKLDLVEHHSSLSPEIKLKLDEEWHFLKSRLTNRRGTLEGLKKSGLLNKKRREEEALQHSIRTDTTLQSRYGSCLNAFRALYQRNRHSAQKEQVIAKLMMFCGVFDIAREIGKLSMDEVVSQGEMRELRRSIRRRMHLLYLPVDKAMFKQALSDGIRLSKDICIASITQRFQGLRGDSLNRAIDDYVEHVYANTCLTDTIKASGLVGKDIQSLLALKDPMLDFVAGLVPDLEWFGQRHQRFTGEIARRRTDYMRLMKLWKKDRFYPDSDMSLRLSYGSIQGYRPRDAVKYEAFTTLGGLMEKDTGEYPFDVPKKLKEIFQSRDFPVSNGIMPDKVIPVTFLSDLDIIGGNSGSPVLNSEGNLVGVVYDRNYEAMIAEYAFLPELNRTISVDIRYMLYIIDQYANASNLLEEMELD